LPALFGTNSLTRSSIPRSTVAEYFALGVSTVKQGIEKLYHAPDARIAVGMNPDFLVMAPAFAGLRAAIELASAGQVLVIAKDRLEESSSEYAQGGIAAAIGEDDSVAIHEQDTLIAGDGLCNQAAVRVLVEEGPPAIGQLIEWGAEFDRDDGKVA